MKRAYRQLGIRQIPHDEKRTSQDVATAAYPPLGKLYCRITAMRQSDVLMVCLFAILFLLCPLPHLYGQEYSVRAVDAQSGKPLNGIPITLRYACVATVSGIKTKIHCKFIHRRTGADGIARFPEAGTLSDIDDIFSLPITYGAVCCDISKPEIPGMGTIKFRRRSLGAMLHWIFIGD